MTFYEALSVFNISDTYTEDKLKQIYRKLAKKYHPDNFKSDIERKDAEEKLKDINIAYEILSNNKRQSANFSNSYYHDKQSTVFNYKIAKEGLLNKYKAKKYKDIFVLSKWIKEIESIIVSFSVKHYSTIDEVNRAYKESINNIVTLYKKLQREFFLNHYINEKVIIESINYNCSLDDFYEQLLKIKEKYGTANVFHKKIEEVTEKYKVYTGYTIAHIEIEALKRRRYIEKSRKLQEYTDMFTVVEIYILMDIFLKELEEEIEAVFFQIFDLQQQIENLKLKVEETHDSEIITKYLTLKINFHTGQLIKDTITELENIKELIKQKNIFDLIDTKKDIDASCVSIGGKPNYIKLNYENIKNIENYNINNNVDKPKNLKFKIKDK